MAHEKARVMGHSPATHSHGDVAFEPAAAADTAPRANILGVGISAVDMRRTLGTIHTWIAQRSPHYICIFTVHSVMECRRNGRLRAIANRSGLTTPDGMPLVWLSRLHGHRDVSRVYGPDLMLAVCQASVEKGYRHFLFGGAEGVADELAARLTERYPGLQVVGTYSPPFRPLTDDEDQQVVEVINRSGADIVWVGLGTPKQDSWVAEHVGQLEAPVLLAVGAAFDFHSGRKRQAPRWMQRSGLEWLYRLLTEPRRLWYRYLVLNPLFVFLVLLQLLGLRRYTLD
jgi:N-acetylglucosaminyldiphosphoundecaprenol N-acetyl-beta-D-mannosaminyltransferase